MLANGGELDGARILSRKTVELMRPTTSPAAATCARSRCPAATARSASTGSASVSPSRSATAPCANAAAGSAGEFMWGGAASTAFWIDPAEELVVVIFMTQLIPSGTFNFRGQLKALVYSSIID